MIKSEFTKAEKISMALDHRNISRRELAASMGVSTQYIHNCLHRNKISNKTVMKIADIIGAKFKYEYEFAYDGNMQGEDENIIFVFDDGRVI